MNIGKCLAACLLATFCLAIASYSFDTAQAAMQTTGEAEFKEYCSECHFDGGNVIRPNKTLSEKDRVVNGVKNIDDIIKLMRNPGEGMTKFDEKTLLDQDARKIAEYIVNTFK
jgi:cytochrome c6